jgi:hypothetical protein
VASLWDEFVNRTIPGGTDTATKVLGAVGGAATKIGELKRDLPDNVMPDSLDTFGAAARNTANFVKRIPDNLVPDAYDSRPSISGNKVTMLPDTDSPRFLGKALDYVTKPVREAVTTASNTLEFADSYIISRPASTLVQAGFLGNPLYRDGIGLDDFRRMWNESAEISPGEAFMWRLTALKSAPAAVLGNPAAIAASILSTDAPPIDIYSEEVRKELDDNLLWNVSSGAADVAFQIFVGGKGVDDAARAAYRLSGLNTKIDGARDLEKLARTLEDDILYVETNGAQGKRNVLGRHLDDIAAWDNAADIMGSPVVNGPKAVQIASMLEDVTDRRTIAKVVMANLGDRRAIAALFQEDGDWAAELYDLPLRIQMANAMADGPITYTKDDTEMLFRIYDRALDRPGNEFYKTARDVFLSTERAPVGTAVRAADGTLDDVVEEGVDNGLYTGTTVNSRVGPMTGVAGRIQRRASMAATDVRLGRSPIAAEGAGWTATVLGNATLGKPLTVMMQWMGGRRPAGQVDLSGFTPEDAVDELLAMTGRIKFTRGERAWTFVRDGEEISMTGPQFRADWISRIAFAQRQGTTAVVEQLRLAETELISSVITRFGMTRAQAEELATTVVNGKNASLTNAAEVGFFFDDYASLVRIVPATQRQLADSYTMFPIEEFAREARLQFGRQGGFTNAALKVRHAFDQWYEFIQKWMRTQQLIKPAYIKNSVVEPIVAMAANLGADQVGSLALSAIKAQKNFWTNRARQLGSSAFWVGDKLKLTPGSRINQRVADLHQKRLVLEEKLDATEAILQTTRVGDNYSPAQRLHLERVADKEAAVLRPQLQAIYRELDLEDAGWVEAVPNARFSDVKAEVDTLNRILDDPETITRLRTQLDAEKVRTTREYDEQVSRAAVDRAAAAARRADIQAQLDLAADPTLSSKRAARVDVDRKRNQLKNAERRLAWAEKVTREGALDMNGTERAALDDQIARLRTERADEQIRASAGEQDMLTSVTPSTSKLDRLDDQIAKLEARREDLTVIEAPIPFTAQEVLDNNPALIARLRAELGDDADVVAPLTKLPDEGDLEFKATIDEVERGIRDRERATKQEIAELEASLPKVKKLDESNDFVYEATAADIADIRATAARQAEQAADEILYTDLGTPLNADWPIGYLSAADANTWRKHGILPLSSMQKLFDDPRLKMEEVNTWFRYGDPDAAWTKADDLAANENAWGVAELAGQAFPWRAGKSRPRKVLNQAEAISIRDGELDVEQVQALVKARSLTKEQAEMIRRNYGINARGSYKRGERLYVRPPWSDRVSEAGKEARLEAEVSRLTRELEESAEADYARGMQEIESIRLRSEDDIAALESSRETYKAMWDEYRESADYAARNGKPVVAPLDDPVPGPFNAALLEKQLREQDEILANAERILNTPFTPNKRLTKLEAQIARAEALASASPEVIERVRQLQDMATDAARARLAIGPFASPTDKVEILARAIESIDDELGALTTKAMSAERRREKLRQRALSGEGPATTRSSQGTTVEYPGLFAKNQYGTAMRQTFSSSYSNKATLDPSLTGIASADRIAMANGSVTVPPSSPMYFEEMAYISNRHVTGDRFVALIMQGRSNSALKEWLQSPAGKKYQQEMSWSNEQLSERIVGSVKDKTDASRSVPVWDEGEINYLRRVLEQYYPTQAVRDLVMRGEVTPSQLREALADIPIDQLSPIQGRAVAEAKPGFMQGTRNAVTKALDAAWGALATTPEDRLARFPFAQRYLDRELTARIDILEQQGVKLTADQFQALKADAVADTLKEARKTFYNIVRYSNPVYAARYLFVYPQAVFNTLYRAARLGAKRPGTAMVANNAWTNFFTDYGVDAEGNITDDYSKVEYLTFNVPPALKNLGVDEKVAFPAKTWEFLSDRQGASWTVQIPAQSILMHKPEWNDLMKDTLGPAYKVVFPFGTPSGLNDVTIGPIAAGSLIPGYGKSTTRALKGLFGMSDEQHLRVTTQILEHDIGIWNYRAENTDSVTMPGAAPTVEGAAKKAAWYWGITALVQWGVPGGGGVKAVGQIEKDIIRNILEKNNFDREKALPEIQQAIPYMDPEPLMASTSSYSAFVPSTIAAYEMVVDPELEGLFTTITRYGNGDPEMAEIIVADKVGEFDANVYDALGAKSIPGSDDPIRDRPPVEIQQARIEAQQSWDMYNAMRANFDAEMIRQGRSTYSDAMQEQWNEGMADFISRPENKTWYAQWGMRDSTTATRALDAITMALADPAMEPHLDSAYWKAMAGYMEALPNFITAYRIADTSDQREALKLEWAGAVASEFAVMSPEFSRMYNKHLADYDLEVRLNGLLRQ